MVQGFDYQRLPSLRRSIVVLNVVLVLLATVAIGLVSLHWINRQATAHALQVAKLSGTVVRDAVARVPAELLSSATILRDRPSLARYIRQRNWNDLGPFLEQFRIGGKLDAIAVVIGEQTVGQAGENILARIGRETIDPSQAATFWSIPGAESEETLAAVAIAPLPDDLTIDGGFVIVSRRLHQSLLTQLGREAGAAVSLLPRSRLALAVAGSPERDILYTEQPVIRPMPENQRYVAGLPLIDEGRMIAAVMTYLPAEDFEKNRNRLIQRWLSTTLLLAAIAVVVGYALGRRLGRPIQALIGSARRMAGEDFSTPVPTARDRELSILSRTMDDMRRRVLELTAALRQREAQAQLLLANVVEGVFAVDSQRRLVYLNPQAARMLDVEVDHALGRFCGDVLKPREVHGRLPCHHHCPIIQARSGSGARAHEILRCGGQRSVVIHSAPPAGGQQVQLIRDETHSEAGRRLRDAVIANVSHEFKTPLAAQTAAIELLTAGHGTLSEEEALELIHSMSRSTVRLNQLIDNLLESVRIDAHEDRLELQPLRIDELIEEVVAVVNPLLIQKSQRFLTTIEPDIPEFSGDAQRLVQVLVNLLSNAIKYAPENTRITLEASRQGETIHLVLTDQGPGLEPGEAEVIFDRFYRVPELSAGQAGMGLGLWIVRSIIERHGGRIEAEGTPGGGTSFRIFLPLKGAEA